MRRTASTATSPASAVAIFAACLLLYFAAWHARTWELADEGLIVRWDLLNRRRLTIPYEHVHTVSVNSTLFERLFGLVTLDLDTGAAAAEGDASKVSGLRESEAEALRAELFRRRRATEALAGEKNGAPAGPAEDRPLATFALTGRRLVLAAASRVSAVGQAFALVVLLGNGLTQLGEWGLLDLEGAGAGIAGAELPALLPLLAGFVVSALALGAVVSFAVNLMRYAGYRVERYVDRAVVRAALWWPFAVLIVGGALWLFGLSGLLESAGWLLRPVLVAAGALSVVLLVVLLFDALRAWGAARYGHTARELVLVSGGLTRRTAIVPRARLQRMRVSQSPFQRRAGVVTLSARTAAGTEEGLGLRDVPADEADVLLAWFRPRARELSGPKVPN